MKTLDEVIKNLEDGTEHLSAMMISRETWSDALHYLKEYKDKQDEDWRQSYIAVRNEILFGGEDDNPPLTWDELKTMEGKPVWITWTVKGKWHHGEWNLVHAQLDDRVWFADGNGEIYDFPQDQQGIFWQAYRKERE